MEASLTQKLDNSQFNFLTVILYFINLMNLSAYYSGGTQLIPVPPYFTLL